MGAWGVGSFENDGALDYLASVEEVGASLIAGSLGQPFVEPDLEMDDGVEVLVAAEIVAAVATGKLDRLPEGAEDFLTSLGDLSGLKAQAHAAVTIVRDSSELSDVWAETDHHQQWLADVNALIARLS
ncbi:DUF4259 domain-containing protein [Ponticaulis sp.]|uniref:DUF4259 domain-containing protein n=1 Tax=Ponticaulis sp. TaxID=2020902 RepID=UPI000B74ABC0|nr:DUF4259 domain-containing protein [Ponticaulis sp.]MAJ07582.1 hypothetical protein [Ponticaulis sp.]RPG17809.1 MAG: DUF4259 domain-containing protein [Hyphomonadaceae bacterium TMED125]HBH89369.1 hypothetical protein [Hyphomonadaceae bacterium]HBJ92681.1 hypothetical protein [Hyphomonadaceae bacterium]|tara:strand:+ start:27562 stop:27945 length:384 start_codon:yes stop_codon:yes gene_type:complete